jgi:hypothetical protein
MMRLEHLLNHLIDAFSDASAGHTHDAGLVVSELELDLPVESRFDKDGTVLMTLPRGQLATGFSWPHGRLRMQCAEVGS